MVDVPIDVAQLVALFCESIFYGILIITFFSCMRTLLWANGRLKPKRDIHYALAIAAVLMFLVASMDVGFGLRHMLDAFVYFDGPPREELSHISYWVNVMKDVCYNTQTVIGDAILIYRCYIIYGRRWHVVALSTLLWASTTVCGILVPFYEASIRNGDLNSSELVPFITSLIVITLANNIMTTSLIIYRIWKIHAVAHSLMPDSRTYYSRVMRTLIESGLTYTVLTGVFFITYVCASNAQLIVSDSIVQIIGITFNLIMSGADRGTAADPDTLRAHSPELPMQHGHLSVDVRTSITVSRDYTKRDSVAVRDYAKHNSARAGRDYVKRESILAMPASGGADTLQVDAGDQEKKSWEV